MATMLRNTSGLTLDELDKLVSSSLANVVSLADQIDDINSRIADLRSKYSGSTGINQTIFGRQIDIQHNYLDSLNSQKNTANSIYQTYLNAFNDKRNQHNQFLERKNSHSVAEIINDHRSNNETGYTALYRADLKENTVFFLSEVSPNEQSQFDVPTHSVDSDDPRTNYVHENSRQLSGTYWLAGNDLADCNRQYDNLLNLAKSGVKFAIDGFSKWSTANIVSLQKQTDSAIGNALQLSIQFNYAKDAHIQTAKDITPKPPAPPVPFAPEPPAPQPSPPGKWVKINPGDTYWRAMTIYGTSIAQLEAWNPWEAHVLPIGGMMRVQ